MRFLLAVLAMLIGGYARGQSLEDLRFQLLDQRHGLSSIWITDLMQDSAGFVWIGTYDGLNRYDGQQFRIFRHDPADSLSLLNDNGQLFYKDARGQLYISYAEGGFSRFETKGQRFRHFTDTVLKPARPLDRFFAIRHVDEQERIWFSGRNLGLRCYDPKSKKLNIYPLPDRDSSTIPQTYKDDFNCVLFVYPQGPSTWWLGTVNGFYRFDPQKGRFTYYPHPSRGLPRRRDAFFKLLPDRGNTFLLAAQMGGFSHFNPNTGQFREFLFETQKEGFYNIINDVIPRDDSTLWVSSIDHGFGIFNRKSGTYRFLPDLKANAADEFLNAKTILHTRGGQLLVADDNGLFVDNPLSRLFQFRYLPIRESGHGKLFTILDMLLDQKRQRLYFAIENGNGLNVLDLKTGRLLDFPVAIAPGRDRQQKTSALFRDPKGVLWVHSRDYLYRFDEDRMALLPVRSSWPGEQAPGPAMKTFVPDASDGAWVLSTDGRVCHFNTQTASFDAVLPVPEAVGKVNYLCIDHSGHLWLGGTGGIGLLRKGNPGVYRIPETAFGAQLRGLAAAKDGGIWAGISKQGLLRLRDSAGRGVMRRHYGKNEGLPYDRVVTMNTDPQGGLWMATISGVVYREPKTGHFRVLDQGLGMNKFTLGMHFICAGDSAFYITVPGHYSPVPFDQLARSLPRPTAYLERIRIGEREISLPASGAASLEVGANERFFTVDFGSIDFSGQMERQFAYRLKGWDKNWIPCGTRRSATYTNLPGGDYLFEVRVANGEGQWSEPVRLPLHIRQPFYKTPWFIALCIALSAAFIYLLYRYRIASIRRTERLRTEFEQQIAETRMEALRAQMNPHFIFNSLNSINRYIIRNDVKTSSLYLTRFAKLIRLVLDHSKHKLIPLSGELEALRIYIELEAFRFEKRFRYELDIEPGVETEIIDVPPLIIQPYVENAIWHGLLHKDGEGLLKIGVSRDGELLLIRVTDNGIGRAASAEYRSQNAPTRKSMGLKLTEERLQIFAEDDGGQFAPEITDLYDAGGQAAGTSVLIKIPIA